ncbi:MAG: 50S ribosomal protein L11 methyltransferase [Chloroflexota bacterium]
MPGWVELAVEVHPEAVDAIAEVFRAHGTGGVAIDQPLEPDSEGVDRVDGRHHPTVKAYLPVTADEPEREALIEQALWHLQAFDLSPIGPMRRRELAEEDWANGWKEHFHCLQIGRVVIKPSWREWQEQAGDIVVELDPGMAFGTGLHPTTRLTLEALQEQVRAGMNVLDLGTGSAILAIAAAKLGAKVQALDISDVAVDVARSNVEANAVETVEVRLGSIEQAAGRFDLILANIIADVLIELAPRLMDKLHPGGTLLASGIIDSRVDDVRRAFSEAGLRVPQQRREGDWWLVVATRA